MELLGLTSCACFAVALVALFVQLRTSFMLLAVTAPLTTVAAFNISDSSVLIYHLVWLAFTARFALYELGERARLDITWLPFLLWCLCSIPLVLFHTDTVVLNIDDVYAEAAFSTQQLTQWAYLLIAIATAMYAECLLRKKVVSVDDVIGWLEAGLVLVLAIALLQQFMSVDFMNTYFRNSAHTGYNWNTSRLSSTFSEPSFLSLYISPLVALVGVRMVYRSTLKGAVLIVGSLLLCLQNQSSSAVVGVAVAVVIVAVVFLGRSLKVRVPHAIYLVVIVAIAACTLAALAGAFDSIVSSALSKLSGEGSSGSARTNAFNHMMGVFANNFVLGIGYGTVRSYDLVSTWLSELGIVGCALFFVPFVATVVALLRRVGSSGNSAAGGGLLQAVAAYLVVAMAIMLVCVSEPYFLSFWIVLGLGRHLASDGKQKLPRWRQRKLQSASRSQNAAGELAAGGATRHASAGGRSAGQQAISPARMQQPLLLPAGRGGGRMMVYLIATAWAGIFGMLTSGAKTKRMRVLLGLLAVLPFCLVAGLRAETVGIDTQTYAVPLYEAAQGVGYSSFMTSWTVGDMEPLLPTITWVATALFGDLNFNMFLYQVFVTVPILFALFKMSPNNIGVALMVYGLLYFPFSLNIMRQSISAAFMLVACAYALESRYAAYILCMALSIASHNTGWFGVAIVPVVELVRQYKSTENKLKRRRNAEILYLCFFVAVAVFAVLLVFGRRLLPLLAYIKSSYTAQAENVEDAGAVLTVLVLGIVFVCLYAFLFGGRRKKQASLKLTVVMILFAAGTVLCQFALLSGHMNRVGRGLLMFVVVFASVLIMETDGQDRTVAYFVLLGLSFAFFMWVFVRGGEDGVVPYSSTVLPILGFA